MAKDYFAEEIENNVPVTGNILIDKQNIPQKDYFAEEIGNNQPITKSKSFITKSKESIRQMLLNNLIEAGKETYREGIAPILHGTSTFAFGIPKAIAAKTGAKEIMYPEQKTLLGKFLRGISELKGFTMGGPGELMKFTGKAISQTLPKALPSFANRIITGIGTGAMGGVSTGDTLKNRKQGAVGGALIGGTLAGITPVTQRLFNWVGKIGASLSGVEKEVYQEASKKGFRNVLQSKFYSKNLPSEIQQRIADNIDNMETLASQEYDDLITPLKKAPFDITKFKGEVIKIANKVKLNPFDTDVSKLDNAILDGVVNKAQANNLGEALDLRRNLDDIIYSNKGDLKTSFGKQVRDLLNKELHQNEGLVKVDKEWTSFKELLREGKKILGDTGEKILARFGNLTTKQKQMLIGLERKVGAPFIEDLANYSLTKEFVTRKISPSISGVIRATSKPLLRGFLRQGEKAIGILNKLDKRIIGKLLGE